MIKSVIINSLKFIIIVVVSTFAFITVSVLLPYSKTFREANQNADPSGVVFVLLTIILISGTAVFLVTHSGSYSKIKLACSLVLIIACMPQTETLFFIHAFPALTRADVLLITVANTMPIIIAVIFASLFFKPVIDKPFSTIEFDRKLIVKMGLAGLGYSIIYFVFGYFVAWQEESLRFFYSGSMADNGFIGTLKDNFVDKPMIYPFQFLRGVLFFVFTIPTATFLQKHSGLFLIGLLLIMLSMSIWLTIPNVLMPDMVRWAHFREMISSMSVFALVLYFIFKKRKVNSQ